MRGVHKLAFALVLAVLFAAALSACGGDSDDSGSGSTAGSTATAPAATTSEGQGSNGGGKEQPDDAGGSENGGSEEGSGGSEGSPEEPSASFRTPGGDNSIQNYGDEADDSEREAAGTALAAYLDARAAGDWAGQCRYLAKISVVPLEQFAERSPQLQGKGCAAVLKALTGNAAAADRTSTLSGPIASLRVEGENGFVLYHGADGVDYFVPMVKEGDEWKVGALSPSEFL